MKAAAEIVVNKPIQDVWAFVSNIENMDRWVKGVTEPKWTSEGEMGVDSTFASKYTYRNKTFDIVYSVTAF